CCGSMAIDPLAGCLLPSSTVAAAAEAYTLSLHDALPIYGCCARTPGRCATGPARCWRRRSPTAPGALSPWSSSVANASSSGASRSEEHTSELQSRENLVCRLLLEKKKEY